MKVFKPTWVNHEGNPIFSIDIHPDGSRFATGGQGGNCGRVTIWNMSPLSVKEDEFKENVPKMLCQLDNHLSCVNCVRWSNNGKYLASAGVDKIIMIWQFAGQGGSAFGGVSNAETWRCCNSLRGHSEDIIDLNWSPNDNYLATCSVDNTVRIWNAENFPECCKIITGHSGMIKGVSWDPMGKYLSTQSDDKSLKIWRTCDWKEEVTITKPFTDCGGTTHVLRLNWCPDGQFLVSAHAMNNLGSTAQIITREDWKTDRDFVGHCKAVTCSRFNPKMFYKTKKDKKKKFFCLAIGSRDRALSVWLTNRKRPLFVMHELFENSVLDISWSHDGYKLLTCSWDGTVAYFDFTESEIGKILDDEEVSVYLHKLYGKNMMSMSKKMDSTMFVEDVELLKVRKSSDKKVLSQNGQILNSKVNLNENTNSNTSKLSKGSTDKQIEMRTLDGRRRITPLYIPPVTNGDGMPIPFNVNQQTTFGSSSQVSSKIQIEKIDSMQSTSLMSTPSPEKKNELNDSKEINSSFSKSLKKTDVIKNNETNKSSEVSKTEKNSEQAKKVQTNKLNTSQSKNTNSSKLKETTVENKGRKVELISLNSAPVMLPPTLDKKSTEKYQKEKSDGKSYFSNLNAPKIDKNFTLSLSKDSGSYKNCFLVVDNNLSNSNLCSLKLVDSDHNKFWQVLVSSKISVASFSKELAAFCCEDNSVHVFYLKTGNRLLTPFLIPSAASKITCVDYKILIITVKAELWLWDLKTRKAIIKNVSLLPLLKNNFNQTDISITSYCIASNGSPLITLSVSKTYLYDIEMESWHLISNNQDLLNYCCDYNQKINTNLSDYPLSLIQSQQRYLKQIHNLFASNKNLQSKATLSYIDQQISSSFQLSSSKEYRYWIITLAQFLTNEGLENRFKELCEFLLGPTFASSYSDWEPTILGIDKRELLKEVLIISTNNLKLQRVYNEFKEQLDQVG